MFFECRGKFSNTANKSLSLTLLDVTSHLKEWIIVLFQSMIILYWSLDDFFFYIINHLRNFEIICLKYEAVAWDVSSGLKKHDITNDEVPDADTLSGTELASNDSDGFLFDQGL